MRHHLLISGTGRAGTSFLMRYLQRLGLETGFPTTDAQNWDEAANAGLERDLLGMDLPYVVKSPFASEYIDDILARPDIRLDGVVVPVRDLVDATSSRLINELRRVYRAIPDKTEDNWRNYGFTAGGLVVSLEPIDEARILALGFHHLVERLVASDVPIVFLAFPRLIAEPGYVFDRLRRFLPPELTAEAAIAAHGEIADAAKVRVEEEIAPPGRSPLTSDDFPSAATLGMAALKRELKSVRHELAAAHASAKARDEEAAALAVRAATLAARAAASADEIASLRAEAAALRQRVDDLHQSRSWRITAFPRTLARRLRGSLQR